MTIRPFLGAAVSLVLVGFAGCGEEDDPVKWSCECTVVCDGAEDTASGTGCGTQDEAEEAVDDAVAACEEGLAGACEKYSCSCECEPTEDPC